MKATEQQKAYARGYAAGRKKRRAEEIEAAVRNERATAIAAAMAAALVETGTWGARGADGVHKKFTLGEIARKAGQYGEQAAREMAVFK